MQFNAHVEQVEGVDTWWADSPEALRTYVVADTWGELWTLGRELAFDHLHATAFILVGPWGTPEAPAS